MAPVVRVLSTSLVAVPAFIRVEPVTTSGPTATTMHDVAGVPQQLGRLGAGDDRGAGAEGLGPGERGAHERRGAARGDADHDVVGARPGARPSRRSPRSRRPPRLRPTSPAPDIRPRSRRPPSPAACRRSADTRPRRARRAGRWCRRRRRPAGRRRGTRPRSGPTRRAISSRARATAPGTVASSSPMRSTISSEEAVSMVELRGLRRSVRRVSR